MLPAMSRAAFRAPSRSVTDAADHVPTRSAAFRSTSPARALRTALAVALAASLAVIADVGRAQERTGSNSGLPVPRFVSLKSGTVNMRVGPGREYRVEWQFTRAGTPVEIIAEFDNWRRVRDADGTEGWVYGALLTGRRTAVVAPWLRRPAGDDVAGLVAASASLEAASPGAATGEPSGPTVSLRADPERGAAPVARMEAGVTGTLTECDGDWCRFEPHAARGAVSGWLRQIEVWGTYPDEAFKD